MKKFHGFLLGILLIAASGMAQEMSLGTLLERHARAAGYPLLKEVNTIVLTGSIVQQDIQPVRITRMRPDKFLMEYDVMDLSAVQACDGTTAWMTTPWTGNPAPQRMPDDRAAELKIRADFDGALFNWESKGYIVTMAGADTVEGSPAWKLILTTPAGTKESWFIDANSYLLVRRSYMRNVRGNEVEVSVTYLDYKPVGGIPFSHRQETRFGGQPYNSLQVENIEINPPVDPSVFGMRRE